MNSSFKTLLVLWGVCCGTLQRGDAAEWTEVRRVGDFCIRADFSLVDHPRLVPELLRLDRDLSQMLRLPSRQEPIHLLLFADRPAYEHYLQRYFRGAPVRRALFIKGSQPGWVFAYVNEQFEIDVRHETTHALLHSRLPLVPLWLDEGLAEYFEVAAEQRLEHNPHQRLTKWNARFYQAPDLRELEELSEVEQMGKAEYRAAWAWVHFMLHGPDPAQQVLVRYLQDLRRNVPPGRLSERLQQALDEPRKAFLRHHRR